MSIKVEAFVTAGNYLTIGVVLDFNMSLESIILWEIVASPAWIAGGHEGTPGFEHEVGNCRVTSPAEEVLQFCSVGCSLICGFKLIFS